jgi:hypothetical protein
MNETCKITLGGKEFECQPIKFGAARKGAFRAIRNVNALRIGLTAEELLDPMSEAFEKSADAIGHVFQQALAQTHHEITPEWMEENVLAGEIMGMLAAFPQLMRISGFVTLGEAKAGSRAPETLTNQTGNGSAEE